MIGLVNWSERTEVGHVTGGLRTGRTPLKKIWFVLGTLLADLASKNEGDSAPLLTSSDFGPSFAALFALVTLDLASH